MTSNIFNGKTFNEIMEDYFQVLQEEEDLFNQICQEGGYGEYPLW